MFPLIATFQGGGMALVLPLIGCTLAQGSVLAAWLVWNEGPFYRRLVWHWAIAGGLCSVWLCGLAIAAPPGEFREAGGPTVALTVPVVSLGAQFPLWIARLLFGWRLVSVTRPPSVLSSGDQSFSIRDLMLATLIVALSFALARLSPAARQEAEFRVVWGMFMAVAAAFSTLAIIPAAAILLRPRPFARAIRYALYLAAAPILLLWLAVAVIRIYGLASLPPWFVFVGLTFFILTYAGTAILAAAALRDQDYRLDWGRPQAALAPSRRAGSPPAEVRPQPSK